MKAEFDYKISSGCSLFGVINEDGKRISGTVPMKAIRVMRERANGLGGGFAGYGIYPKYAKYYAFHILYDNEEAKKETETYLNEKFSVEKDEQIPTREYEPIKPTGLLWRYFLKPKKRQPKDRALEGDFVVNTVMHINVRIKGAFVVSSGKNMGIFKGVGFPEEIGKFYRLEKYKAYSWITHGRFPTNTVGWWGGAHPFGLLDWSVVHNGEISSYGINRRYLLNSGYHCTLFTDTEVMTYLFDLLVRKHGLDFKTVGEIISARFWDEIERMPQREKKTHEALRMIYGSALVNGPFAIIVGFTGGMVGINDRIKLRPLVAGRNNNSLYISSEEAGIREVCPSPERVWMPKAGEPVIGRLKKNG